MNPHVSSITLGVEDVDRAKKFYSEGLGWPIQQDHGQYVAFAPDAGSSTVGIFQWDALAGDAGVDPAGSGFRGFTLSYVVRSEDRVATVMDEAERAGATIVKPAERQPWGGTSGVFADPDGYLWKVGAGSGDQPYAE